MLLTTRPHNRPHLHKFPHALVHSRTQRTKQFVLAARGPAPTLRPQLVWAVTPAALPAGAPLECHVACLQSTLNMIGIGHQHF